MNTLTTDKVYYSTLNQKTMESKTENSIEDILRWMDEDVDPAFARLLPSEEYGENEDASLLWQIIKDSEVHLTTLIARVKELESDRSRFVAALDEIVNPIKHMQIRAAEQGAQLNGSMAIMIAKDPSHLQGIAAKALKSEQQTLPEREK
jgi:hypothetical protein